MAEMAPAPAPNTAGGRCATLLNTLQMPPATEEPIAMFVAESRSVLRGSGVCPACS